MKKLLKWVEIDSGSLMSNIKVFNDLTNTSGFSGRKVKMFAVVKANAYGHGILEVSQIIKDEVYGFAVNSIEEGKMLRLSGIVKPILVLGYIEKTRLKEAVDNDLIICVYNKETIIELGSLKKRVNIHFKIDTGLSRQGIFPSEVKEYIELMSEFRNVILDGVYTHFADVSNNSYLKIQNDRYLQVLAELNTNKVNRFLSHTSCTASVILYPELNYNAVRIGLGLYGLWSSREIKIKAKNCIKLKPVMTWKTRVVQTKWVPKNTPVGYGLTFRNTQKTKIAVLPVGYSDGYDIRLGNKSYVVIKGKRCKVLGKVMMNIMVVDVTSVDKVELEDEVIIFGSRGISVDELAKLADTINYEILTSVNSNIPRIII